GIAASVWGVGVSVVIVARLVHAGGVGLVDGIVARKGIRVLGLKDRVAAQEAADHGIIEARTEIDDVEWRQEIAVIPLLGGVLRGAWRGTRTARHLAGRPIVKGLQQAIFLLQARR